MQNDYVTLKYLTDEMSLLLSNGTIDKILMPENDEIVIGINTENRHYNLLISANCNVPRIHITNIKKNNPTTAFAFCMFLRKHFQKAIINSISLLNNDRIFDIHITSADEFKDSKDYHLIFEQMGRFSNIFILNKQGTILNSLKSVPFDTNTKRDLVHGAKYEPLRNTKESIENLSLNKTLDSKELLEKYSGINQKTANEIIYQYSLDKQNYRDKILNYEIIRKNNTPIVEYINDKPSNYYIFKYNSIKGDYKNFNTLSEAIETVVSVLDNKNRLSNCSKELSSIINIKLKRINNSINKNNALLVNNTNYDKYREYADLLMSNIHLNKTTKLGTTEIKLQNYFNEMEDIKVPLNPLFSIKDNAIKYYEKYNKKKRQIAFIKEFLIKLKEEKESLERIQKDILLSTSKEDLDDIKNYLISNNILKSNTNKKGKNKNKKTLTPTYYHENIDGYDFYMGRNALQNNYVTFKIGEGKDIWMHTKNYHGAHGIISCNKDEEISNDIIIKCAKLVAMHSECKEENKVEVDYTLRKYVKKHPSKELGQVIYTNYSTITVKLK